MTRYYSKSKDECLRSFSEDCSNPNDSTTDFGQGVNIKHEQIFNDINVAWETPWKGTISGGINNFLDVKPRIVFAAGSAGFAFSNSSSVDPTLPIDRFYYIRYTQKF
jgi:iron complex outermembrane recepter protein